MWGAQEVRQKGSRDRDREVDCASMLKTLNSIPNFITTLCRVLSESML